MRKALRRLLMGIGLSAVSFIGSGVAEDGKAWLFLTGIDRFVDGDTFVSDGIRVRLWGVDSPEIGTRVGNDIKEKVDRIAAFWNSREGFSVLCMVMGRSFDRIVARCSYTYDEMDGSVDMAAVFVRLGLARDCPAYSGGYYSRFEDERAGQLPVGSYCKGEE